MRTALIGIACVALAGLARGQVLDGPQPPEFDWEVKLGAETPLDAAFVDAEGREVRFGELLGDRPTLLVLLYYECPMLCDLVLDGVVRSLKAVGFTPGADFSLVALSIDPDETIELARSKRDGYLQRYGRTVQPEGWRFVVGDEEAIRAVANAVGFEYVYVPSSGEYAHAAGITLLTSDGRVSRYLFGIEFAPRDLRFALIEASEGRIGSTVDKFLLRCFHYDPARGRYGFAIMNSIRFLGGLTVALLAWFVLRALRRDRKQRVRPTRSGPYSMEGA